MSTINYFISRLLTECDIYRKKQHSSVLRKRTSKGRRGRKSGKKVLKLPEIEPGKVRSIKKATTPNKRMLLLLH